MITTRNIEYKKKRIELCLKDRKTKNGEMNLNMRETVSFKNEILYRY